MADKKAAATESKSKEEATGKEPPAKKASAQKARPAEKAEPEKAKKPSTSKAKPEASTAKPKKVSIEEDLDDLGDDEGSEGDEDLDEDEGTTDESGGSNGEEEELGSELRSAFASGDAMVGGSDMEAALMTAARPVSKTGNPQARALAAEILEAEAEAAASMTLEFPPHLDIYQESETSQKFRLLAFADGCMECGHLIPSMGIPKKPPPCHFSLGRNDMCPAESVVIQFVGARRRLVNKIRQAQREKDSNRLIHLINELNELSIEDKNEALKELGMFS